MTERTIDYNSQRDKYDFDGQTLGDAQCLTICMWMLMSAFNDKINASDDDGLLEYVNDIESSVGESEDAIHQDKAFAGAVDKGIDPMFFWKIHQEAFRLFLIRHGVSNVACALPPKGKKFHEIDKILGISPVILGTRQLGGVDGGHTILLLRKEHEKNGYWVHDPYGDARTSYRNPNGANVFYSKARLLIHATNDGEIAKRCAHGANI